jgi:hypothetical protein
MRAASRAGVPKILSRIAKKAVSIVIFHFYRFLLVWVGDLSGGLEIVGKNRES